MFPANFAGEEAFRTMAGGAHKVAIVTGSTQGLGEAIARRLVDEALIGGLVICGRSAENGERLAREFSARGCRTEFVQADLAVGRRLPPGRRDGAACV